MTTVRVDYECNAVVWWAGFWAGLADARFREANPALYDALQRLVHSDWVEVGGPLAAELVQFARALPGWADEDAPEYAPHPLLIVDADNGEAT